MMIITIVKYSEYIYVILVTQVKGIQVFFKFELLFPDLWHFQILRKRIAQILSVTEQFETCILKGSCTRIPNLSSNLRLEHYL